MNSKVPAVLFAILTVTYGLPGVQKSLRFESQPRQRVDRRQNVNIDLCPLCVQFTSETLDALLNIILNTGVVGSCEMLCSYLEKETSEVLGVVCNILCDIVGIREFIKIVEQADLDPIYFCELAKVCQVLDGGDATIINISVTPQTGPQDGLADLCRHCPYLLVLPPALVDTARNKLTNECIGERKITVDYISKSGTGTGEIVVAVRTVDGVPVESAFLKEAQAPGVYTKSSQLKAQPDPSCDPTEGPCEQWIPGNYTLFIEICNGECGSKHPHSKVYDHKETNFTII